MFQFFHAPHEPWVIRLPAAIAGVLTVLGLYLLVAELFGDGAGLLAAFLLATSFWHINFSRIGFRAILAPLLLAWSLCLLIKAFRAASRAHGGLVRRSRRHRLRARLLYLYRLSRDPAPFLAFHPVLQKTARLLETRLVFIIAAFIVAAPIGWYFVNHPRRFLRQDLRDIRHECGKSLNDFAVNTRERHFSCSTCTATTTGGTT